MTAFHQLMPVYFSMDPSDDIMEDSIYATQEQAIEDIDIDFEFNDDPAEDEQMGEDDPYVGDPNAGLAQTAFDHDDEMADDEQINTFDASEQSAPQQPPHSAVANTSAEPSITEVFTVAPLAATTDAAADEILVDFDRDFEDLEAVGSSNEPPPVAYEPLVEKSLDKSPEIETFTNGAGESIQPHIDISVSSTDFTLEHGHGTSLAQEAQTFEATNNITPHDAASATLLSASGTTQADIKSLQQGSTSEAQSEGAENSTKEDSNESEGTLLEGDASTNVTVSDLRPEERLDSSSVPQGAVASVHETKPEKVSSNDGFSGHNAESGEVQAGGEEHEGNDEHDESPADESFNDLAIIVEYDGQELSLFPPHSDEASDTFLLSDHGLLEQDLHTLITACKRVLSTDSTGEELILNIPALGLEIAESASEATTTSLAQLRDMYVHLSHNDGVDLPDPLRLELFTRQKVSAQIEKLLAFVEQGKGLTALIPEPPEFADNDFTEGSEDIGERNSKRAPNMGITEGGGPQHSEPTFAAELNGRSHREETPEDLEGDRDDFLDFRSPMHQPHGTPSKPSGFSKDQTLDRPNQVDAQREDFLTRNDTTVDFEDFDHQPGKQQADVETEQLFQLDSDLSASQLQRKREAHVKADGSSSKDVTNDQRTVSNSESAEIEAPASSTVLVEENDFITGDSEKLMDSFDKDDSRHGPGQDFNATRLPQEHDDGFDFDDFLEDQDSAPINELGDSTVDTAVKTDASAPESFGATETVASMPAQGDGDPQQPAEQARPEEDEIDFSDDELDNEPAPAAIPTQAKADSLKRMRSLEEDVDALEASPNGTKKQRPD